MPETSMKESWRLIKNSSESPKDSAFGIHKKSRKFIPLTMRSIDKISFTQEGK